MQRFPRLDIKTHISTTIGKSRPITTRRNHTVTSDAARCKKRIEKIFGCNLPKLALVLGSGFHGLLSALQTEAEIPFSELPGFPIPQVRGHPGQLVLGTLRGLPLLVCAGRAHYYEGHSMPQVMFPIEVLAGCGVEELILTSAAGGINRHYQPGDFMIFADHINLLGVNPLRGIPVKEGSCFIDLTDTYCTTLRGELKAAARRSKIPLHQGVYIAVSGPSYETPAEIRAFRRLGADAVGMSTVPETLMARYRGIRVAGLSCITNHAAGMEKRKISHEEVLLMGEKNAANAAKLFNAFADGRTAAAGKEFEKDVRNR